MHGKLSDYAAIGEEAKQEGLRGEGPQKIWFYLACSDLVYKNKKPNSFCQVALLVRFSV